MSKLFSPLQIQDIRLKNRMAVSPMCQYSSIDGFANDWHLVHLGCRATGGAGLIITEATAVSAEGRISPDDLGIWKDEHIENLSRITAFLKKQDCVAGIQLAHAGRKASHSSPWKGSKLLGSDEGGWQRFGASDVPFIVGEQAPVALHAAGIDLVLNDFRQAASRALQAGFEVIEIHAAHGYLLHEFYSPLSNNRTDKWGGSFENRIRLLLEVVAAVKEVWPAYYPLFVRISASDYTEGGWTLADSVQLARALKKAGVHLIDCSSGGNVANAKIPVGPGYQVHFAEMLKKETGILTGAVGLITNTLSAEEIIVSNRADLVLLGRQFLRDPYFPLHAAQELHEDVEWPVQYERAKPK